VLGGLLGRPAEFVRTPKHRLEGTRGDWRGRLYRGRRPRGLALAEAALGLYFTVAVAYAAACGMYASLPFLILFQGGFLHTAILSLAPVRRHDPAGAWRMHQDLAPPLVNL
jgi:hypothetical protein